MTSLKQTVFYSSTTTMFQEVRKPSVSGWTNPLDWHNYKRCFKLFNKKRWKWHCLYRQTDRTASLALQHLTIVLFALWGQGSCWKLNIPMSVVGTEIAKNKDIYQFFPCLAINLYYTWIFIQNFVASGLEITMQSACALLNSIFLNFKTSFGSILSKHFCFLASQGRMQWRPLHGPIRWCGHHLIDTCVSEVRIHGDCNWPPSSWICSRWFF